MISVLPITGCVGTDDLSLTAPWPEWAFRHWVWENESTQQSAIDLVDGYLERGIPVGAIIIDSPWATGYSTFEFDRDLFPDPQGMIDYFHAKDVRVMLWTVSAINVDVTDLYAYADAQGYFMQRKPDTGAAVVPWWKGNGSLIDYFNPDAVDWWHGLVDTALDLNIDGWKADGLDYIAWLLGATYSPGRGDKVTRQEYADAYYRDFFDYTRQRLGDDRIITARPVDTYDLDYADNLGFEYAPVDINWAGWVGDQDATFEGLRAALLNMFHSARLGYVAFGSDIGAFRREDDIPGGRTKELFIRWAQLGALCPVMENGGSGEHRPWAFDAETTAIYKRFTDLHYRLIPYLMTHGAIAFAAGESLVSFLDATDYRFFLGPDIFVAPMLGLGTRRSLQLPAGDDSTWVYLFAAEREFPAGARVTLDVPYSEFPVFLRKGSPIAATLLDGS